MAHTRTSKWLNFGLLLASIVFALLICEIVLRIGMPQIGWAPREDPVLGWADDEYRQFDPTIRENDALKTRVLFLGDSFIAGSGVSRPDNRFPIQLAKKLGGDAEVRILATQGWGTDQELLAFRRKGKAWAPDIVVVAFCANNDIANILSHHHGPNRLKPYFVIDERRELDLYDGYGRPFPYDTVETDTTSATGVRSYLLDFLRYRARYIFARDPKEMLDQLTGVDSRYRKFIHWEEKHYEILARQKALSWSPQIGVNHVSAYIHNDFPTNTYQWRLLERILGLLKTEVEDVNGKLVVMLLPVIFGPQDLETVAGGTFEQNFRTPAGRFTFRSAEPRDRLHNICECLGITFFDPTAEFIAFVRDNDLVESTWPHPRDRHFSDVGHELLANISYAFFSEKFNLQKQ